MSGSQLENLFQTVGIGPVVIRRYLDGMLIAATAAA
jgi:hypothetical protein